MKQLYMFKSLLIACIMMLFGGGNFAFAQTDVTFDATIDKTLTETNTISKDGITIKVSSGTLNNGTDYRCFKGQTLTISSESNIQKIVFTCTANNTAQYGPGCFTTPTGNYSYSDKIGTWEGSATSVVFTASSAQVRMTKIEVTIGGEVAPTFSFSESSREAYVGETFQFEVTNTYSDYTSLTYSSSKEDVATVDGEGTVTPLAVGTTTITATLTLSDNETVTAFYDLTVSEKPELPVYKKVTSAGEIVDGGVYLVVCEAKNAAMGFSTANSYMPQAGVELTDGVYVGEVNGDNLPYEIVFTSSETNGYYTIKFNENGKYLNSNAAKSLSASDMTSESNSYLWSISLDTDGNIVITNKSVANNRIQYNASSPRFCAYVSAQTAVQLYKKVEDTPAPTTGTFTFVAQDADGNYYATFSTDHYIVFPEEVELSTVTGINEDGTLKYFVKTPDETPVTDEVGSVKGSLVPKNTGVLLKSSKAEVTYYFPTSDVTGSIYSWFKPVTNEDGTFEGREGYKYYKLAYNDYEAKTGLGFYWGAENGAPFKSKKGLAYLEIPETTTSGAAPTHFLIGGGTDGISNVESDVKADKDGVIYNIAGQRVNAATKPGLYIIGGKKVVVK